MTRPTMATARRGFLGLVAGAALVPALGRIARADAPGAPVIPPPAGMVALAADDPMRSEAVTQYAAVGQDLLETFFADGGGPFLFADACRTTSGTGGDLAGFREDIRRRAADLAAYEHAGGPATSFQIFDDLRFERRLTTPDSFLWMGRWTGYAGHRDEQGLWAEASLWLGGQHLVLTLSGVAPPLPDAGWTVLTAWVDAVRAANGAAPLRPG